MDKLKLVKLIFFADREHIVRHGRAIVGGTYCAMPHGPVPSDLLDDLNQATPGAGFPFEVRGKQQVKALNPVDEEELSESDISVLEVINARYGTQDAWALRNLTHELNAYKKNYPDPTEKTSHPLPYEDFFLDLNDDEMLQIIRDHQEAMDF